MSQLRIFEPSVPPESDATPPEASHNLSTGSVGKNKRQILHRIAQLRQREAKSLKAVADSMNVEMREARDQEQPDSDLRLSNLYQWQKALGVSLAEILLPVDRVDSQEKTSAEQTIKHAKQIACQLQAAAATQEGLELADLLVELLTNAESEFENLDRWMLVQMMEEADQSNMAT